MSGYIRAGSYNQLSRETAIKVIRDKLLNEDEVGADEVQWLIGEVERLEKINKSAEK